MAQSGKQYIIGRGRLFFDEFAPGTKSGGGERYLGNTPELSSASDSERLDHYDSDEGLNVKDESILLENNLSLSFTTDNISPENIALWFAGTSEPFTVASAEDQVDVFEGVTLGRFLQLGTSANTPTGARNVTNVVVSKVVPGPAPEDPPTTEVVDAEGNLEIDLESGRIYLEPDATDILSGDTLSIAYDIEPSTRTIIIGKGQEIRGSLRFISKNPVGAQRDYFWPYVTISSNGDYALKGSEWQQMSFTAEVLKKDGSTERVYIDARD